ncbi:MAG: hypothetical protein NZ551_05215 [Microscillaceae bacterium]|nr:hypothetical protein [Microscillaceae bacterium]MDW8460594.1 hypothetical protein [Cytophagales bacterium]
MQSTTKTWSLALLLVVMLLNLALFYPQFPFFKDSKYEPIYASRQEIDQNINGLKPARPLRKTGKIYTYNHFIFIGEENEGIHVIDNRNPSQPIQIGFIEIKGNKDIAIKNNMMYLDNQQDLIVYNLNNYTFVQRIENVFNSYYSSVDFLTAPDGIPVMIDYSKGIFIGWRKR